jgi:hypothetical protein
VFYYTGDYYKGNIDDGKPNGNGSLFDKDHDLIFKGEFKDGIPWNGYYERYGTSDDESDGLVYLGGPIENGYMYFVINRNQNHDTRELIYGYNGYFNGEAEEYDVYGTINEGEYIHGIRNYD